MADIKPAYLLAGDDEAKIEAALARLRARAEREGGPGALESFAPPDGVGAPDLEALAAAIPAMSLTAEHRYLLADHVERAAAKSLEALAAALAAVPADATVVLVERPASGRERPSRAKVAARNALGAAVEGAGGEVHAYGVPKPAELPRRLVADAGARGFELELDAARMLVERMGARTARLANELDRLALWAEPGGRVGVAELEAMVADTSEEATWTFSDAIVDRDRAAALAAAERLAAQGESVSGLVWQGAKRLRAAAQARAQLDAGRPAKEVAGSLGLHPYAARMLVRRLGDVGLAELRAATCALADLEWWTRGGSDYPDEVAVTLAIRRATGGR
jgi:DNA polymerase III subunit delta